MTHIRKAIANHMQNSILTTARKACNRKVGYTLPDNLTLQTFDFMGGGFLTDDLPQGWEPIVMGRA